MTSIRPIPVDRYLVPDPARRAPALPADAIRVRQAIVRGLPAVFPLDSQLALVLYVPTGDALRWRDADPAAVVLAAADDLAPRAPADADEVLSHAPARLVLIRARGAGENLGAAPLRLGPLELPDDGASPVQVELWLLDYALHAGTLQGAGDRGSFIDFAWRRVDRGTDAFALPPLDPRVAERFAGQVLSSVGGRS